RRDRRQEKRTIVTAHAGMASHNMKEKEGTQRIRPSLQSRQVYFIFFAAVRALTQSNPAHDNKTSAPANHQRTPSCCCCLFNFEHFRKKTLLTR
ncbi:MAG TPA: hypothetical protein VN946_19215, partial [Terriglobales bacterium]|nr:hypothetical protein [Terriglobales bacterium]